MAKRLEHERRSESRRRHLDVRGGEGLFASGIVIILITLAVNPDRLIAIPVWITCVSLIIGGLWQLRANPSSLRVIGTILGIAASLLLGFIGVRALQASQASGPLPMVPLLATPDIETTIIGTPGSDRVLGEVSMAGGNAFHDGIMPGPAPSASPDQLWQFDTGGEVHGAATLSNGVLFAMSKSGSLVAIDAGTGQQLWAAPITGYVTRVSPAVADGVVFAGGGFAFGAWDANTGKQLWTVPLQYVGQSSPVLTSKLVIVSSQERWTYALNRQTGEIVWRVPTEGIVFGAPAIAGNQAFYATDEGIVYAVDLESGRVVWRQMVTGSIFGSPVVSQGLVLVATQAGEFAALDSASGSIRWTALHGGSNPPATNGDIVVVSDADGGVYGLDLATGEQ
ncbi:MAG TPA: PQQ-binding-like beta-propeller repeat protein, partial [Thermomicrobiales bacterium]|nr:PQQ-binding-like beta-propeller repeat protein [Thermomicrobiales bacterium]